MNETTLSELVEHEMSGHGESVEDIVHIEIVDAEYVDHDEFESPIETDDPSVLSDFEGRQQDWSRVYPDCTIWTDEFVYKLYDYDGKEYFDSVRRDPNGGDFA
ncbi:hypothetical protein GOC74_05155 [Halomicrobium mukohataei]|uniref:Uncharacterized protein n=1 Tax=Halomicrobium mukohataei TaxID=57705 RepID=A0A847UE11_9EURY|nr:hypothetical protein [Halomicrobium mukohataei]NLV09318.1 hypothetical protein [Halomicrobium mukohataei]